MSWHSELREFRKRIMQDLSTLRTSLFGFTMTSRSSALGNEDAVETGDGEKTQINVQRIEPFGLRYRAPGKVRSLHLKLGSSNVFFIGVASNSAYGPQDLEDGEIALYNAFDACNVVLNKNREVVVNEGTKPVARKDDPLDVGTMGPDLAGPFLVTKTYIPTTASGPGTPQTGSTISVTGIIADGAARFKG